MHCLRGNNQYRVIQFVIISHDDNETISDLVAWCMDYQTNGTLSLSSLTPARSHSSCLIHNSSQVSKKLNTAAPFHAIMPGSRSYNTLDSICLDIMPLLLLHTLGFEQTSIASLDRWNAGGNLEYNLCCSISGAPGNDKPPPTTRTLPYSFFFTSSDAKK